MKARPRYRCPGCGRPTVYARPADGERLAAACISCGWAAEDAPRLQLVKERLTRVERAIVVEHFKKGR